MDLVQSYKHIHFFLIILIIYLSCYSCFHINTQSFFFSDTLSSCSLVHGYQRQTHTHTQSLKTVYRVSWITRCYGNSAATHQRDDEREREKSRAQIWGPDRWIDKKQEKVERDLTEERGLNGEEMMRVRELEEDGGETKHGKSKRQNRGYEWNRSERSILQDLEKIKRTL